MPANDWTPSNCGQFIEGMALSYGYQLKASLTVRPELRACRAVEGWTVKPFMVRQAHHERP